MMTPPTRPDRDRVSIGRRLGAGIVLTLAGALLLIGTIAWVVCLATTANGYKASGLDGQFIVLGWSFWAVPWFLGTLTVLATLTVRQRASQILLAVGGLLLVIAIISSTVGAH